MVAVRYRAHVTVLSMTPDCHATDGVQPPTIRIVQPSGALRVVAARYLEVVGHGHEAHVRSVRNFPWEGEDYFLE